MSTITDAIKRLEKRNISSAKDLFSKATHEAAFSSAAHAGLAICHAREDSLVLAKNELEEAMKQGERGLLHYLAQGFIFDKEGKTEEAEKNYIQATRVASDSSYAHLMLGSFLLMHERNEEGIVHLTKAKELGGNTWQVNRNLAIAYLRKGKSYQAFGYSMLALVLKPSKEEMSLVIASSFKIMKIIIFIILGFSVVLLFQTQFSALGFITLTIASIITELIIYLTNKEKKDLILLFFLVFILGWLFYLNYIK